MDQEKLPSLKEIRPHGTKTFPCAIYQTRAVGKGTLVKHHWHDEIEILYFLGGNFQLNINMETFPITSECIYFINPGELHSIVTEAAGSLGEDAVVFHPGILSFETADATQIRLLSPIRNGQLIFPRSVFPGHPAYTAIRDSFYLIMNSFGKPLSEETPLKEGAVTDNLVCQLMIKSALLQILAVLVQHDLFTIQNKRQDHQVESVKTALTYMRERYSEKIHIQDLAKQVNMNEQYFCRLFKKAIGCSPIQYLNRYRIRETIRLLENTDKSVLDISLECGFHNFGNFMREFKKQTGTTPLQYRKSHC